MLTAEFIDISVLSMRQCFPNQLSLSCGTICILDKTVRQFDQLHIIQLAAKMKKKMISECETSFW